MQLIGDRALAFALETKWDDAEKQVLHRAVSYVEAAAADVDDHELTVRGANVEPDSRPTDAQRLKAQIGPRRFRLSTPLKPASARTMACYRPEASLHHDGRWYPSSSASVTALPDRRSAITCKLVMLFMPMTIAYIHRLASPRLPVSTGLSGIAG